MTPQRRLLAAWLAVLIIGIATIMLHRVLFYPRYMVRILDYRIGFLNSDAAGYAAVRSFSANHLILDGDFRRAELPSSLFIPEPDVTGTYLTRSVAKGALIRVRDTRPTPLLKPASGLTIVSVAVGTDFVRSGAIDADLPVSVMIGRDAVRGVIEAIVAGDTGKPYTALVSVPPTAATRIVSRPATSALTVIPVPPTSKEGQTMDQKDWKEIGKYKVAPKGTPWVLAIDYVPTGTLLKITTADNKQEWIYGQQGAKSGPDGDAKATAPASLPMPTAPVGCLIAKLGGSTSAITSTTAGTDGTVFAVGSFCVRKIDDTTAGPLYLGMNVAASNLPDNTGEINVVIYESKP